MLKVVISNRRLYKTCLNVPVLKHLVTFDLSHLSSVEDQRVFVRILEDLRMGNGTYKTTGVDRLSDVNSALVAIIDNEKTYEIHDVAASDGITSTELWHRLKQEGKRFSLTISDKYSELYYSHDVFGRKFYDSEGNYLFRDFLGVFANRYLSRRFIISHVLGRVFHEQKGKVTPFLSNILLLNPSARRLIESKEIRFIGYDIFQEMGSKDTYDVIRCMNILNLSYFSRHQIENALRNILKSMRKGCIFIVGRTDRKSGINNVTIYREFDGRLKEISRLNKGSEITDIIDELGLSGFGLALSTVRKLG